MPRSPAKISGAISGNGGLIKSGPGVLVLSATNTYLGATTISAGTLQLGDGAAANGSVAGNIQDNASFASPRRPSRPIPARLAAAAPLQ